LAVISNAALIAASTGIPTLLYYPKRARGKIKL